MLIAFVYITFVDSRFLIPTIHYLSIGNHLRFITSMMTLKQHLLHLPLDDPIALDAPLTVMDFNRPTLGTSFSWRGSYVEYEYYIMLYCIIVITFLIIFII